jgi:hypothetical protein
VEGTELDLYLKRDRDLPRGRPDGAADTIQPMNRRIVNLQLLCLGLSMVAGTASAQSNAVRLPIPAGLAPCDADDPVAKVVKRAAASMGAEELGCFRSEETTTIQGSAGTASVPRERAFASRMPGGPYSSADLDSLLSKVRDQWRNFDPLSTAHREDYVARINAMVEVSSGVRSSIRSITPLLVSIEPLNSRSYVVVSIRKYAGQRVSSTKVDGLAMALQGGHLLRMEIQRELTAAADVDDVRRQIAVWAGAVTSNY